MLALSFVQSPVMVTSSTCTVKVGNVSVLFQVLHPILSMLERQTQRQCTCPSSTVLVMKSSCLNVPSVTVLVLLMAQFMREKTTVIGRVIPTACGIMHWQKFIA